MRRRERDKKDDDVDSKKNKTTPATKMTSQTGAQKWEAAAVVAREGKKTVAVGGNERMNQNQSLRTGGVFLRLVELGADGVAFVVGPHF